MTARVNTTAEPAAKPDAEGWFDIVNTPPPRAQGAEIDLWGQCFDLADRDRDDLVPTVGLRIPRVHWFDGNWCDENGNVSTWITEWVIGEGMILTHWRWPPAPPVSFAQAPGTES